MNERQSYYIGAKGLIKNSQGKVLIIKDVETGRWELPGGRIDKKQSIEEAFRREIAEELPGSVVKNFGNIVYAAQGDFTVEDDHKLMLLFFSADVKVPDSTELSHEHTELAWVNSQSVDDYQIYASDKAAIKLALA
jgi:8-oxo-dGTP diphosphatase